MLSELPCLLCGLGTQPSHEGHSQDTRHVHHVSASTKVAAGAWALSQNWEAKISEGLTAGSTSFPLLGLEPRASSTQEMLSANTLDRSAVVAIYF